MEENYKKKYDLEERTLKFALLVRDFVKLLPRTISNIEYSKQIIRSSASIGANYIEANDNLGTKDFLMKIKISRKEAKETIYWLRLIDADEKFDNNRKNLLVEARELMLILSAIIKKF